MLLTIDHRKQKIKVKTASQQSFPNAWSFLLLISFFLLSIYQLRSMGGLHFVAAIQYNKFLIPKGNFI